MEGDKQTKEDVDPIWKKIKEKDSEFAVLGYGYYKLPIQLTSNPVDYQQSSLKKSHFNEQE